MSTTTPTTKLTKRSPFQVKVAAEHLGADTTSSTISWPGRTPAEVMDLIMTALPTLTTRGQGNAMHSVKRAVQALLDAEAEATPEPEAPAAPSGHQVATEAESVPASEVPAYSTDPAELVRLAKAEHAALKVWAKDGSKPPAPATPNLDELNRQHAAGVTAKDRRKAARATGATPRQYRASVLPTEGQETMTCTGACGQELPLTKFPTTSGGRRGTECRKCRDARKAAAKAEAAQPEAKPAKATKAQAKPRPKAKARKAAAKAAGLSTFNDLVRLVS